MKAKKYDIAIAGAGIGGLVAALSLIKKGYSVLILEQAKQLGEVGAGLQLSPNANRVLFNLGLGKALETVASVPTGKAIRLWKSGKQWPLFDLGQDAIARFGFPYYTVHRADLHRLLVEKVRSLDPEAICLDSKVTSFEEDSSQITIVLENGRRVAANLLVGADGVHSCVRSQLTGPDDPRFSGLIAWRGVIPASKLPHALRQPVPTNWVGPGAHAIHYPLRRGELINFVGIVERSDWQVESWNEIGTIDECMNDFKGWNENIATMINNLDRPYKWALMLRDPLENWTSQRVALLGDACHPTLPMLASGAAMAIEDGYVLARCLDELESPLEQKLKAYQSLRKQRTDRIVTGSAENAKRFHNPLLADDDYAERYISNEWSDDKIIERYSWIFEYDVDKLALNPE